MATKTQAKRPAVIYKPITELTPFERNPRSITKAMFNALKKAIEDEGMIQNLVVDEKGRILGGHQRWKAAKALKIEAVPCIVLDLKGDEQRAKKINLQLNKISGEFDYDLLFQFIDDLPEDMVSSAGFAADELEELKRMAENVDSDIDEAMAKNQETQRVAFDVATNKGQIKLKYGTFKCATKEETQAKFLQLFDKASGRKLCSSEAGFMSWLINQGIRALRE